MGVASRALFCFLQTLIGRDVRRGCGSFRRGRFTLVPMGEQKAPIRRWDDLKMFLLRQFRPSSEGSLYEQWLSTSQTATVQDYPRKFIETATPLERISDILLGQFVNSLKEEIKMEAWLSRRPCGVHLASMWRCDVKKV